MTLFKTLDDFMRNMFMLVLAHLIILLSYYFQAKECNLFSKKN